MVWLALLALLIELMVGYPDRLARAIGHPVSWIGRLIGALDMAWNRASAADRTRRIMGLLAVLLVVAQWTATAGDSPTHFAAVRYLSSTWEPDPPPGARPFNPR